MSNALTSQGIVLTGESHWHFFSDSKTGRVTIQQWNDHGNASLTTHIRISADQAQKVASLLESAADALEFERNVVDADEAAS